MKKVLSIFAVLFILIACSKDKSKGESNTINAQQISGIEEKIKSEDNLIQIQGLTELNEFAKSNFESLFSDIQSKDEDVRSNAIYNLGNLIHYMKSMRNKLWSLENVSTNEEVVQKAKEVSTFLGTSISTSFVYIFEARTDDYWRVRYYAIVDMSNNPEYGRHYVKEFIEESMNDDEERVRTVTVYLLGKIVPELKQSLKYYTDLLNTDATIEAKKEWFKEYEKIEDEIEIIVAQIINALLDDDKVMVRKGAANALGRLGKDAAEALQSLKDVMYDEEEDKEVREEATDAYFKIKTDIAKEE
ncbi:MAG TPA: HEAT repeat domain-containing protein [Bdellovibrionota bacterium]|nr:HEAT repeat domain-containing protein [Bdellovibrionota bacterium]